MSQERWDAVDAYFAERLLPRDPALADALAAGAAAGLPAHGVSPSHGRLLELLVRIRGARRVLEVGTLAGYSTLWLARGLPPEGRVITLERDPRAAAVARESLDRAGLEAVVDVRVGPALETLAQLAAEDPAPFDLVFLDADKAHHADYLGWGLRLTRPGSVIVADNVVRGGGVLDAASEDPSVAGVRRFADAVAAEPRLAATAIQTVGEKGHDGFVLAVVVADG